MVQRWSKKILVFVIYSILGMIIFSFQNVNAISKYNPVNEPIKISKTFIKKPVTLYNIYGHYYSSDITVLDLSNSVIDDDLKDILSYFNNLRKVNLTNHTLTYSQIADLKNTYPNIEFVFTIKLGKAFYNTDIEELDLSYIQINDLNEFKETLRLFKNLKVLDMSECNLSNEQLGHLREEFPNVQIDWVIHLSKWRFRTDVKSFSVLVYHFDYVRIKSKDLEVFKYCWNMEGLDLGHQAITDVSLIAKYLPNLKILILADNKISDISPLASLTKLHYLELFINPIHDISALSNLKELVDINLCYNKIRDFSPLYDLPMLERIWLVGSGASPKTINTLRKYHPKAQIVNTGGGSTNSGFRTHERYYEMIKMFKDRYYMSPSFTKYDRDIITEHNYLNEMVDVIIDHKLGSKFNNTIYLTNFGYLKDNRDIQVHVIGEFNPIGKYHGKVIGILQKNNKQILIVSNKDYSKEAIKALIEYKEDINSYKLVN